ncbi:MAG: hypothetical protein VW999_14315 [Alphaproteobacteria bacterium]
MKEICLLKSTLLALCLMTVTLPAAAQGELVFMNELVVRDGLFFKAHTRVPFTGTVRGRGQIVDGLREGAWIFFDDNGQRLSEGTFTDGKENGPWVFFHPNGQMASKGGFKNGASDGRWMFFNPDGTEDIARSGTYRAGARVD